ncbi:heme A synthase [Glaciimonas sp. PAMC28666]|uniref:COX15/CtaA family protein n=1 Tax=Glaciimonas sp. PAMC28666 TaxID=2807626 RepID=UPI001966AF3B|nr:COX15/CtaA family protein [Glaciimonas sp. PAMC28666]QRX83769.1 COX15/CtaA family protein [Glaciimonas sp. PAMC28666]
MSNLLQLGAMGILVALLALSVVWASKDANKYRKLVWVTLFLTFDLIMFGAFTRLTDSGLGCPDWPGCYGHSNPLLAQSPISAAQAAMPTGPVTLVKAWIEMTHRYFAMGVGVLIIGLMAVAWMRWLKPVTTPTIASATKSGSVGLSLSAPERNPTFSPWLPTLLFLAVCLQGAFGAWTVTMKLQPVIVTTHLLLGLTLLALLTWLAARQNEHTPVAAGGRALAVPALIAMLLLVMQIALGGWVSTNYAALACNDFPLCHGMVIPDMDFQHGFTLWRHLGKTADGEYLPFQALTAIHWTHRMFAFVVIAFIAWLALRARRIDGLRKTGTWLLVIIGTQLLTGLATIYFNWPLAIAVAHNGGAALILLLLVMLNYKTRLPAVRQFVPVVEGNSAPADRSISRMNSRINSHY